MPPERVLPAWLRRGAWLGCAAVLIIGCGGGGTATTAVHVGMEGAALTTVFVPEGRVAPRTAPPTKDPTTTAAATTTTTIPLPAGFPGSLPLPEGNVGYYTGSPELGFHLNISTAATYIDLVRFFTAAIEDGTEWRISVRDIGRGFVPGYEGLWAPYTADDHVVTRLSGEYTGAIEIEQRHVNILLDPPAQPEPGVEPALLPPPDVLPRPDTEIILVNYSSGLVRIGYAAGAGVFEAVVDAYRELGWVETSVVRFGAGDGRRSASWPGGR